MDHLLLQGRSLDFFSGTTVIISYFTCFTLFVCYYVLCQVSHFLHNLYLNCKIYWGSHVCCQPNQNECTVLMHVYQCNAASSFHNHLLLLLAYQIFLSGFKSAYQIYTFCKHAFFISYRNRRLMFE